MLKHKREEELYAQCKEKIVLLNTFKTNKKKTKDDKKHARLLKEYLALYENLIRPEDDNYQAVVEMRERIHILKGILLTLQNGCQQLLNSTKPKVAIVRFYHIIEKKIKGDIPKITEDFSNIDQLIVNENIEGANLTTEEKEEEKEVQIYNFDELERTSAEGDDS